MEKTEAQRLAFKLDWVADNRSCSGLLPAEVRKAARLLETQERELVELRAALAAKDHQVTVELSEPIPYRMDAKATFVITDPRMYWASASYDVASRFDLLGDNWMRHEAQHLVSVATEAWRRDLAEKTYAALRKALEARAKEPSHAPAR